MRSTSRATGILIVAISLGALPSCNGSSNSPTTPPSGGGGGPPAQNASVTANNNNTFSPSSVTIVVGGTVTFTNAGGLHNVSTGVWACAVGCSDMGGNGAASAASWTFNRTFPTAGTTNYVCDEHAGVGMVGNVIVQ